MCASNEVSKILKKYGSHEEINKRGVYDYLFKVWTIWILIILKYKNGAFFLETESIREREFNNLIEKEDCYKVNDNVNFFSKQNPDQSIKGTIENIGRFPYYRIKSTSNKYFNVHYKNIEGLEKDESWSDMFIDFDTGSFEVDNSEDKLSIPSINDDFMNSEKIPSRGKSPFDEIKNYKAWYWGGNSALKPQVVIKQRDRDLKLCKDYKDNTTKWFEKIKIKKTNNYYRYWSSNEARQVTEEIDNSSFHKPFEIWGDKDITILRPYEFIDEEEHPFFKTYKPLGDVMIDSSELSSVLSNIKCEPNNVKYKKKNI